MTKHDLADLLEEYLDGALDARETRVFEAHLESCAECREELASCRRLLDLGRALPFVEAPADLAGRLRSGIAARSRPSRGRVLRRRLPWAVGAVAAAMLLLVVIPSLQWTEESGPGALPPVAVHRVAPTGPMLEDWLLQAGAASPEDVPLLAEEARALDLAGEIRARLALASGAERDYLVSAEDLLIQLLNDPEATAFPGEAAVVAMGRRP